MPFYGCAGFTNNTATELEVLGYDFDPVGNFTPTNSEYWGPGGLTNIYSLSCLQSFTSRIIWPSWVNPGPSGWFCIAFKTNTNILDANKNLLRITSTDNNRYCEIRTANGGQALDLYVDNDRVETTSPIAWANGWNYLGFRYDMSTTSWSARIYHNQTPITALNTDVGNVASATVKIETQIPVSTTYLAGAVAWDDVADSGEVPYFIGVASADTDGINVGTWTDTAGTDHDSVAAPINAASNTSNASPAGTHRMQVTCTDIDTVLGTTTGDIAGMTVAILATGQAITARAVVGDGTAETNGSDTMVAAATTTLLHVASANKPSGGAWTGSDALEFNFDVVSV